LGRVGRRVGGAADVRAPRPPRSRRRRRMARSGWAGSARPPPARRARHLGARPPADGARLRAGAVVNGEVYSFPEIRRELEAEGVVFRSTGDTEVVLAALVRWGSRPSTASSVCSRWRCGTRTRHLLLVRDRFGVKPLFIASLPRGSLSPPRCRPCSHTASEPRRRPQRDRALAAAGLPSGRTRWPGECGGCLRATCSRPRTAGPRSARGTTCSAGCSRSSGIGRRGSRAARGAAARGRLLPPRRRRAARLLPVWRRRLDRRGGRGRGRRRAACNLDRELRGWRRRGPRRGPHRAGARLDTRASAARRPRCSRCSRLASDRRRPARRPVAGADLGGVAGGPPQWTVALSGDGGDELLGGYPRLKLMSHLEGWRRAPGALRAVLPRVLPARRWAAKLTAALACRGR